MGQEEKAQAVDTVPNERTEHPPVVHWRREVPPYQIPLGSLIARDSLNLMMAVRCFSADQRALSSARVSTMGSMMGQAAGIAAALCADRDAAPRDLNPAEVRGIVEKRGGRLDV